MNDVAKLDPYQQKGLWIPIAIEWNQDTIAIQPKLNFPLFAAMVIVWMLILVGTFAYATQNVAIVCIAIFCTGAVAAIILWATHAEATAGPYVVIDSVERILTFPRLQREIRYSELRRLHSGKRYESTSDSTTLSWFVDAEVIDFDEHLWIVTLVATQNWWEFQRLEQDLRRALESDDLPGAR